VLDYRHKAAFNKKTLSTNQLNQIQGKNSKISLFGVQLSYGAENWTRRKVDQKYLEGREMCCWRRLEKIIWNDREEI
jgi:hypothetical protein